MPVSSSPQQRLPDEGGNNQQRQSCSGFRDSGENQRLICCPHFSWFRAGGTVGNGRKLLGFRLRVLLRFEFEGQLVDLTGELERNIIAILQHYRLCRGAFANKQLRTIMSTRRRVWTFNSDDCDGIFSFVLRYLVFKLVPRFERLIMRMFLVWNLSELAGRYRKPAPICGSIGPPFRRAWAPVLMLN